MKVLPVKYKVATAWYGSLIYDAEECMNDLHLEPWVD